MNAAFEIVNVGYDSSGRPLKGTRQMVELAKALDDHMGGIMVPIQGSFNAGVSASAGTHDLAGCWDWRNWHMTSAQMFKAMIYGRDRALALFPRTVAQGFDPHFHGTLLSDSPMTAETQWQRSEYLAGRDMLGSRGTDNFYRPVPLVTVYNDSQGEDMGLTDRESKLLAATADDVRHIEAMLARSIPAEQARDADERRLDRERSERSTKRMADMVDMLGQLDNQMRGTHSDVVSARQQIRKAKAVIMQHLRDDPSTDGTRNDPTPEAVTEAHKRSQG